MNSTVSHILTGVGSLLIGLGVGLKASDKFEKCDFKCHDRVPIGHAESIEETEDGITVKAKLDPEAFKKTIHPVFKEPTIVKPGEAIDISMGSKPKSPIEIIDVFDYDTGEYEKGTLVYFTEDGVVCDEGDNIIHEWQELVGEDAINHFGEKSAHEDIVYIRNHKVQTDYEFIREYLSYNETVLNFGEKAEEIVDEYTKAKEFFGIDDVKEE